MEREREIWYGITHLICRGAFERKLVKITKIVPSLGLSVITSATPHKLLTLLSI